MNRYRTGVIALVATAVLVGLPGTAAAAAATVGNTDGDGLNIRSAPTTSSSSVGVAWDGQAVNISCQIVGQSVTNTNGFESDLWDYVPGLGGYLADAYMATGYDYWIPGVPECDGAGAPDLVPVSQFHGQPNQSEDCGPASVVSALLAAGVTPRGWPSSPLAAINQARRDMGLDPTWQDPNKFGTNESDVVTALAANGVSASTTWNFSTALAHVRAGRPVVMAGNMIDLPWSGSNVAHFLTVAAYDDGVYLVLDPASEPIVYRASQAVLAAFWDHDYGRAAVLV